MSYKCARPECIICYQKVLCQPWLTPGWCSVCCVAHDIAKPWPHLVSAFVLQWVASGTVDPAHVCNPNTYPDCCYPLLASCSMPECDNDTMLEGQPCELCNAELGVGG